jgi:hypothetical protein
MHLPWTRASLPLELKTLFKCFQVNISSLRSGEIKKNPSYWSIEYKYLFREEWLAENVIREAIVLTFTKVFTFGQYEK